MSGLAAIFVDYENIRISLKQNFKPRVSPSDLAIRLKELACEHGEWRGGTAYADWSQRAADARAFEDAGFNPRMVLRKRSGPDRSDMVMSLDMIEWASRSPEVTTYVLVSGDADFQDVLRRLQHAGKTVIVAGCAPTSAAGLVSAADQFVALESRFKLDALTEDITERRLPGQDWAQFIDLLLLLEEGNRYIGINRLVKEWMASAPEVYGETLDMRRGYLDLAKEEGIVVAYQAPLMAPSEEAKRRLVWCVRLDRQHPVVRAAVALGQASPEEEPPDEAVKEPPDQADVGVE